MGHAEPSPPLPMEAREGFQEALCFRRKEDTLDIRLLRHATHLITTRGVRILVDPMLSPAGAWDPIQNTPNPKRNPLVDLPLTGEALQTFLSHVHAAAVTHSHFDHWDGEAVTRLAKDLPVFCQPEDSERIAKKGFLSIQPVDRETVWKGVSITRTGGQHGTGEIGKRMGTVSGFVFRAEGEPSVYVAGDTIWCGPVEEALAQNRPDVVVVYAGAAQFLQGGPITMTAEDVIRVARALPDAWIVAVHMEAINHCVLGRQALREKLAEAGIRDRVAVPEDGESLTFPRP